MISPIGNLLKTSTHNLQQLLKPAGLAHLEQQDFRNDRQLEVSWGVVKDWNEKSRYQTHGRKKAKDMIQAVSGAHGVFECLKKYW